MRSKIFKRLPKIAKWFGKKFGGETEYAYKGFSILLPTGHLLPIYQAHHPSYDQFLPQLVQYIDESSTIIDVGANCGDTLAAMVDKNAKSRYVEIEPDDVFFGYLSSNVGRIKKAIPELDVTIVKSLVGNSVAQVALHGTGGTKRAVIGAGNLSSRPLDEIIRDLGSEPVGLIKIDVDGFDYDVLDSAQELLARWHPILFFECQYEFDYQKEGYKKTIGWLKTLGYVNFSVFDNFGELMLREATIEHIFQLMEYVWRQNQNKATRTIHYFDILAATSPSSSFVCKVLGEYQIERKG